MKAIAALAIVCSTVAAAPAALPPERHVVLVVWDGMRPDFVTPQYAPTLDKLARDGVRFLNHHSVYCTATNVNGTAIATGVYPNRSGIFANSEFRPAIDPRRPLDTADQETITGGDKRSDGKYLGAATIAELVRGAGKRVALSGSKSAAVLHDRHNEWTIATAAAAPLTIFAGAPIPAASRAELTKLLGPLLVESTATARDRAAYATHALTEFLWRDGVPEFSLLWLGEPDLSEHNHAPGSPEALAGIKAADDDLAAVLHALDAKHARETTDVLVVSDHGFSTIRRSIDVVKQLAESGFHATKQMPESPKAGDILLVGDGGTVLFYVYQHDRDTCQRVTEWLQESDFAGAMFTREKFPGTLPLSAIRIDTPDAPDIVMSFRWTSEKNQFGVPGMIDCDWNRKPGQGTHATLSPFDVHNTFIAAGPDFRRAFEDPTPTGNIDIAPTVLHLLGVQTPAPLDGRIIREALREADGAKLQAVPQTVVAKRPGEEAWQEWLRSSRVDNTVYFDTAVGGKVRK